LLSFKSFLNLNSRRFFCPFFNSKFQLNRPTGRRFRHFWVCEHEKLRLEGLQEEIQRRAAVVAVIVYDEKGNAISHGRGFIIRADGAVATNYHVKMFWFRLPARKTSLAGKPEPA
jgi:S1-C subfamily serine protease